jgi:pantoate kinase
MVKICVPIHISGVWMPVLTDDPLTSGSIGLGLVVSPEIVAEVERGNGVVFNGTPISLPNVEFLSERLGKYSISISSKVPLGFGYGISAAISLAYSVGAAEHSSLSEKEAVKWAHVSEVLSGNGLGDVIAEYLGGGITYRKKPGAPFIGEVEQIEAEWESVYSLPLERMPTIKIVREASKVDPRGLIAEFQSHRSLTKFFEVSKNFNEAIGFKSELPDSFRKKGIVVSMAKRGPGWIEHRSTQGGARLC